jgi:hypothetical protein
MTSQGQNSGIYMSVGTRPTSRSWPLIITALFLAACGGERVSARIERWECTAESCVASFVLSNGSNKRQLVNYELRAHRVSAIRGGEGARRNEVVGELADAAELSGLEKRHMTRSLAVSARPTQVVVSAWVRDDL